MGVGSKWMKPRSSMNNGTLTSNVSSLRHRGSASSSFSGVTEGDAREKLSELSTKEREEIDEIVETIHGDLHNPPTDQESASKSWKICRVPKNLREIHEHDFDPKLVSIGPFHRHRDHLEAMEEDKKRFLLRLLNSMDQILEPESSTTDNPFQIVPIFETESLSTRSFNSHNSTAELVLGSEQCDQPTTKSMLEVLVVEMKKLETKAKDFYSERFNNFGPNEFVRMMILGGCFVVELLRLYAKCETSEKEITREDPIFSKRWILPKLQRDLLLFENQLPFFVLEKLFDITSKPKTSCSLMELTIKFFDPLLPRYRNVLEKIEKKCKVMYSKPDHLLALFHSTFFLCISTERKSSSQYSFAFTRMNLLGSNISPAFADRPMIHCVTELKEAGVLFRIRENYDLLDIEFKNGKLYIPPLIIDDHTCPVFLNFVTYEQCNQYLKPPAYFTHYLLFFDSLVNSSKDVEHLHYKGIISHVLGSDEHVADLFNKLCKEVVYDFHDCYLAEQLTNVNQYFHIKIHKWWATWKHDYFRNPWAFSSYLAAISLLFLTFVQSFFSVFAYFLPPPT